MTSRNTTLRLALGANAGPEEVALESLAIASWTGRDREAMERRLAELEAMGIPRPPALPMLYRVAAARATTAAAIEVVGTDSTGEAEFVLLRHGGRLWVGVGSDHTDRAVEAGSAVLSKQACDKPVSPRFWALEDVLPHWDTLRLRSWITTDAGGAREPYQDGGVASMMRPSDLVALLRSTSAWSDSCLLFCGTLPTLSPIRHAAAFEIELEDPVRQQSLSHRYTVASLPPFVTPLPA